MPLSTLILVFSFVNKTEAPPVAVKVAVLGFGAPYSVGFRNCFSLDKLCEEHAAIQFLIFPLSI